MRSLRARGALRTGGNFDQGLCVRIINMIPLGIRTTDVDVSLIRIGIVVISIHVRTTSLSLVGSRRSKGRDGR
jgi:hypothetical protein